MMTAILRRIAVAIIAVSACCSSAYAQNTFPTPQGSAAIGNVVMCPSVANPLLFVPCDGTNPLAVSGTISATIGGFTPSASGARGTPLTVTTSDSSGNLPTGAVVVVSNVGTTNPMYCNVNGVAATVSDQLITANGGWFSFTIPATVTTLHCIATGGSTTANMVGGSGLPTGTGGGSGGSGGGGAITIASGAVASGAYSSGSLAAGSMVDLLTMRGTKAPGTAAANSLLVGCVRNTGGVTPGDTQQVGLQCGPNGEVVVTASGLADNLTFSTGTQTFSGIMGLAQTTAGGTGGALTDGHLGLPGIIPATRAMRIDNTSVAGTAVDTNSGNKSAGTQRFVVATDQLALATWGQGATGATVPAGATLDGCRAASAEPTAVTDGQMVAAQCGLGGKQINLPYAIKEKAVRGKGTGTDTAAHTIIAAGSGSDKTYVTGVQCSNSSATNTNVTLSDDASSVLYLPATGGNNATFNVPLATAAATAFSFTASTGVTTVTCNAQGYYGL